MLLLYRDEDGIRLLGVGSPDGENTWWLEQHLGNSGQRHYCISQGVLYGVTAAASPLHRRQDRDQGTDAQGLLVRAESCIRRSEWGSLVPRIPSPPKTKILEGPVPALSLSVQ